MCFLPHGGVVGNFVGRAGGWGRGLLWGRAWEGTWWVERETRLLFLEYAMGALIEKSEYPPRPKRPSVYVLLT